MKKPNLPKMPVLPSFDFRKLAEDFKSLDPKDIGTWPILPTGNGSSGGVCGPASRRLVV
jgi:hypothetical protein